MSILRAALCRLAQACETHLKDTALAGRLRAVAAAEDSRAPATQPPTVEEAIALANALSRYGIPGANLLPLGELAQEAANALAGNIRRQSAGRVGGLYVIVDPERTRGRDVVDVAGAALKGGASAIQLRDKVHDKGEQLPVARQLRDLCDVYGAVFIVNDHADLAVACGAHGLHVGKRDLPVTEARRILYPTQFLGTSNALVEEAQSAVGQDVDYIAVGSIYATSSKSAIRHAGVEVLRRVRQRVQGLPIVAIGGITRNNVDPVLEAGADGICVISAVCMSRDPEQAARRLVQRITAHRTKAEGGRRGAS